MRISKIVFTFLILLVLAAEGGFPSTITVDLKHKKRVSSMMRSFFIPGWGQFSNGQETKGSIVLAGAVLSGGAAYYYFRQADSRYNDYKNLGVKDSDLYNDYSNNFNNAQGASYCLAAFWLYGVLDAYFSANVPSSGSDKGTANPVKMSYKNGAVNLLYQKKF
jgi:hypothetical protein